MPKRTRGRWICNSSSRRVRTSNIPAVEQKYRLLQRLHPTMHSIVAVTFVCAKQLLSWWYLLHPTLVHYDQQQQQRRALLHCAR
jgi:hypothetical protein